jgi:glycosyltransferase involved in cell wall biosynthesis
MQKVIEVRSSVSAPSADVIPVSVIIAARNEANNLPRCLQALRNFGEVFLIDSQSMDDTAEIARSYGAQVVQFHYQGGWPKKRQWAMDSLPIAHEWVLLLDADEVLPAELAEEIRFAIQNPAIDGYSVLLQPGFWAALYATEMSACGNWHCSAGARGVTNAA